MSRVLCLVCAVWVTVGGLAPYLQGQSGPQPRGGPQLGNSSGATMQQLFSRRIKTRQNAIAVVDSVFSMFHVAEALDPAIVKSLKTRLSDREYEFATGQYEGVEQGRIADAFNFIVEHIAAPDDLRLTDTDISLFRDLLSLQFSGSISRQGDTVTRKCRPLEALYILFLLDFNGGFAPSLRQLAAAGKNPLQMPGSKLSTHVMPERGLDIYPPGVPGTKQDDVARESYFARRQIFVNALSQSDELKLTNDILNLLSL